MVMAEYWLAVFLFERGLGLVYLIAFLVALRQFRPLIGKEGLEPVDRFVQRVDFSSSPSLFYLKHDDTTMAFAAYTGVVLSVLAATGVSELFGTWVAMLVWFVLWLLYLSFVNVGQTFWGFGWESLLLEAGFLAVFLGGAGTAVPEIMVWLLRWLLFRVMFGAGLIKLRGDACWRYLTCLQYHYETQPMPNPLSWYADKLPDWFHRLSVVGNHVVELVVPFLYFAPQPYAAVAGLVTIGFQGWLMLTGNFSWLNFLTIVLATSTFSDAVIQSVVHVTVPAVGSPGSTHMALVWGFAGLVIALSYFPLRNMLSSRQAMNRGYDPFHLVNTYGAFGSITKERYEVVIEATMDEELDEDTEWEEYEFHGKPGDLSRHPPQFAPYHLRLDWQMWFAAMSSHRRHPWFKELVRKLLEGDGPTLDLLRSVPFDEAPEHVRARLYRYEFTSWEERKERGGWWDRELVEEYFPPVSLEEGTLRPRQSPGMVGRLTHGL